jgi:hypothetical protein
MHASLHPLFVSCNTVVCLPLANAGAEPDCFRTNARAGEVQEISKKDILARLGLLDKLD